MIKVDSISYQAGGKSICKDISLEISKGSITGVIGPNGSGKSTLLKQIYGLIKPDQGHVFIDQREVYSLCAKERALIMGVMSQENSTEFPYTVEEITLMGRSPYHGIFQGENEEDRRIAAQAMTKVGVFDKKEQDYNTLSGGEKQRVLLARVLAQNTDLLILDEPTNHLDIGYQWEMMEFLSRLPKTIVAALHDLNLAANFCQKLILLNHGEIVSQGGPEEVLTEKTIREIFRMEAKINRSEGRISIEFIGSASR